MDVVKRIEELRRIINYHNHKYNVDDNPEISDYENDKLYHEFLNLKNKILN